MRLSELSAAFGFSKSKLYKLVKQRWKKDPFPAFKQKGTWYVDPDRMLDWLLRLIEQNQVVSFAGGRVRRVPFSKEAVGSKPGGNAGLAKRRRWWDALG